MVLTLGFTVTELPTATGKPPDETVYQVGTVLTGQLAVKVTGVPVHAAFVLATTPAGGGGAAKPTLAKILDLIVGSQAG